MGRDNHSRLYLQCHWYQTKVLRFLDIACHSTSCFRWLDACPPAAFWMLGDRPVGEEKFRKKLSQSSHFKLTSCFCKLAASPRTGECPNDDNSVSFRITHSIISRSDKSNAPQCSELDSNRFLCKKIWKISQSTAKNSNFSPSITLNAFI